MPHTIWKTVNIPVSEAPTFYDFHQLTCSKGWHKQAAHPSICLFNTLVINAWIVICKTINSLWKLEALTTRSQNSYHQHQSFIPNSFIKWLNPSMFSGFQNICQITTITQQMEKSACKVASTQRVSQYQTSATQLCQSLLFALAISNQQLPMHEHFCCFLQQWLQIYEKGHEVLKWAYF